jgi:hypothetical protein
MPVTCRAAVIAACFFLASVIGGQRVSVIPGVAAAAGSRASIVPSSIASVAIQPSLSRRQVITSSRPTAPASRVRGGVVTNTLTNAVVGAAAMALIEAIVKKTLAASKISFPASLGACLALFVFLLLAEAINADFANTIFASLTPGAALLAKWLPVFFVPGLVLLPLSPAKVSNVEVRSK